MKRMFSSLLLLTLLLTICSAPVLYAEDASAEMPHMKLVYSPYDFTLDVLVAIEKGFFKQAGLDLEPVSLEGGTAVIISTLHRGEVDGCFISSSGALTAIDKGIPLVMVSGIGNRTFDFYTLKDSPVNTLADFEGRKVGNAPRPGGPWLALIYDLETNGINATSMDVKFESDRLSGLLSGQLEIINGSSYIQAFYGDSVKKVWVCTASKYIWNSCGWWFKPEYLEENPEAVKRFVEGITLARTWMSEHYDETVAMLAKSRHLDLKKLQMPLPLPTFDIPPVVYKYGLRKTAEIMLKYDLIKNQPDIDASVDGRFAKVIDTDY